LREHTSTNDNSVVWLRLAGHGSAGFEANATRTYPTCYGLDVQNDNVSNAGRVEHAKKLSENAPSKLIFEAEALWEMTER